MIFSVTLLIDERLVESTNVNISNCTKGICRLRRKSIVHIDLKFTPGKSLFIY